MVEPSTPSNIKPTTTPPKLLARILVITSVLLIASALLYAVAIVYGEEISRGGHSSSVEQREIIVGNEVLRIPENIIRFSHQRHDGARERVDLYMHWPDLAGYSDHRRGFFNASAETSELIFATIERRNMVQDMSGRIGPIYKRFFEGQAKPQAHGLTRQPLSAEGGFIDEDLYYQSDSAYPFAARCMNSDSAVGTAFCIRDVHVGRDLSLTYRFHRRYLNNWIALEQAITGKLKKMLMTR